MLVLGLTAVMALSPMPPAPSDRSLVELTWRAPDECPTPATLHAWIEALTPGAESRRRAARAEVAVERTPEGYAARIALTVNDRRDSRSLEAPDCVLLARATAVVVAVSLDPIAVAESPAVAATLDEPAPPDATPPGEPVVARPPEPLDVVEPTKDPRARPPRRSNAPPPPEPAAPAIEAGVRLGPILGGGVLPSAGLGVLLAPFVGISRLHVRATAQYWTRRRIALDPRRDAAGELRLLSGGVRICPRLQRGRVHVPLCGGVDGGVVFGQGIGEAVADARSARAPWAAAVLEPGVELSATPWLSVWIALEGVVSLYRPVFAIDGAGSPWTAGPAGLRGLVGLQLHRPAKKP